MGLMVLRVKPSEAYLFVQRENPQPRSDPSIVRMARWPKTSGELEGYIGAESVRTIRQEKELCLSCVHTVLFKAL